MVVYDFSDDDSRNVDFVDPAVFKPWDGVLIDFEHEPFWMIEINRELLVTVSRYPTADVLLAFADYNAAVEGAPESVPYAYEMHEKHLNDRWIDYQQDRDNRRAAQGQAL